MQNSLQSTDDPLDIFSILQNKVIPCLYNENESEDKREERSEGWVRREMHSTMHSWMQSVMHSWMQSVMHSWIHSAMHEGMQNRGMQNRGWKIEG